MSPWLLSLYLNTLAILATLLSIPVLAEADFASVRTNLDYARSYIDPKKPSKYFHEARFNQHYDGRFGAGPLNYDERQAALRALIQTFLATMADYGVESWLMHGTLLGWYWNRKILPWDSDIDVMVSETGLWYLAKWANLTVHRFEVEGLQPAKRRYLLEVNPNCWTGGLDAENAIDARWIDTDNGLYIDITTLRRDELRVARGEEDAMMVKDRHHYVYGDIFPLVDTTFEGMPAKVPYAYGDVLVEEYHEEALTRLEYESHRFDKVKQEWVPYTTTMVASPIARQRPNGRVIPRPVGFRGHPDFRGPAD